MLTPWFRILLMLGSLCITGTLIRAEVVQGYATALIISRDGYLLTSAKPLEKSQGCSVMIGDTRYPARQVMKNDAVGFALLKIDAENLPALPLSNLALFENAGGVNMRIAGYSSTPYRRDLSKWHTAYVALSRGNDSPKTLQLYSPIPGDSDGFAIFSEQGEFVGLIQRNLSVERRRAMAGISVAQMNEDITRAGVTRATPRNVALDDEGFQQLVAPGVLRLTIYASPDSPQRITARDGAIVVPVPAGPFTMGSDDQESAPDTHPVRTITLDAFWISKYEVTVTQFRQFCSETERTMPELPDWAVDESPMVNVSWHDANAYAKWAGAALPSEAQWEKAARSTDARPFPWGIMTWEDLMMTPRMQTGGNRETGAYPVGSYPNGASPYGVQDMASSVWEWCADWYHADAYAAMPDTNPQGPDNGQERVIRGGCWFNWHQYEFRTSARASLHPELANHLTGFRCVYPEPLLN